MATTWLIPDNFADILPRQARTMEAMRRTCLDLFRVHGFELVQPPMVEYVDSLLTGSGTDVSANTFKFMDQNNGRMVGIRADVTPQIARIDAHILGRKGVCRLCYDVSCLHARPMHPMASREPVVCGCEMFGASGFHADAEMIILAVHTLRRLGIEHVHLDIGHTAVLRAIIGRELDGAVLHGIVRALRMKDPVALAEAAKSLDEETAASLQILLRNYGGAEVLDALLEELPYKPEIVEAVEEVRKLARVSGADECTFDFCDVHGYQYLTGMTFSAHIPQYAQAVLRGGRYDGVGLAFGRSRPACGFTVYLRALASVQSLQLPVLPEAVIARGPFETGFEEQVQALRNKGLVVVRLLPGERLDDVKDQYLVTHELVRNETGCELVALDQNEN